MILATNIINGLVVEGVFELLLILKLTELMLAKGVLMEVVLRYPLVMGSLLESLLLVLVM